MPQLTDHAYSTLASAVTAGATSWTLDDASGFPDPANGQYWVRVWDPKFKSARTELDPEEVRVTAKVGNVLTVVRGEAGETGAAHSAGAIVAMVAGARNVESANVYYVDSFGARGDNSTDNQSSIQTAVDTIIASGGGRLRFGPGIYLISAPITFTNAAAQIHFEGAGAHLPTQIKPTNSWAATTALIDVGDGVTLTPRWSIQGFSFTGRSPDATLHAIACVRATKCSQFRITDCSFASADYGVIVQTNSQVCEVSGNVMGSNLKLAGIRTDLVTSMRIIGNHILEGRAAGGGKGIDAGRLERTVIANNVINDWEGLGIDVAAYASANRPPLIIGNDISDTGGGIKVSQAGGSIISGNTLRNAKSGIGIEVATTDVAVTGNSVHWTTGNGMRLGSQRGTVSGNVIRNPTGNGIDMPAASGYLISGNRILDDQGTPTMVRGIEERTTADNNRIVDNHITGASTANITVVGSNTIVVDIDTASQMKLTGNLQVNGNIGFYSTAPQAKPTVSGSRANTEQALADLLTELATLGLITDSTTA